MGSLLSITLAGSCTYPNVYELNLLVFLLKGSDLFALLFVSVGNEGASLPNCASFVIASKRKVIRKKLH